MFFFEASTLFPIYSNLHATRWKFWAHSVEKFPQNKSFEVSRQIFDIWSAEKRSKTLILRHSLKPSQIVKICENLKQIRIC